MPDFDLASAFAAQGRKKRVFEGTERERTALRTAGEIDNGPPPSSSLMFSLSSSAIWHKSDGALVNQVLFLPGMPAARGRRFKNLSFSFGFPRGEIGIPSAAEISNVVAFGN